MAESKHETELEETEGLEQPPKKKRRHTKLRRWVSRIIALLITIVLVVGGAPISQSFCDEIGADVYTEDAASAARVAVSLLRAQTCTP